MKGLIKGDIQKIVDMLPDYCLLSGSRALNTATEDSDWDFYIPENKWAEFKQWAVENISLNYNSCITGQISYYVNKLEHNCLIEFSYLFPRYERSKNEKTR